MRKTLSPTLLYNSILMSCDISVCLSTFILGVWFAGWNVFHFGDWRIVVGLIILSLATVSFFLTYHLYSYHVLFSRKEHLLNLAKSFALSFLTFCLIVFLFNSSTLITNYYFTFNILLLAGALVIIFLSKYFGRHFLDFFMTFGMAFIFVGVTGLACNNRVPLFMTNPIVVLLCFILAVTCLTFIRLFLVHIVFHKWLRRHFRRQVVIIGSGSDTNTIIESIVEKDAPFYVVGTLGTKSGENNDKSLYKKQLGDIDNLASIVQRFNIDDIIVTDENIEKSELVAVLDYCISEKINAWFSPKLLPIIDIKLFIEKFCDVPMILLCTQKNSWLFNRIKHILDVIMAGVIIFLIAPFIIGISLAIKLESIGPVFYRFQAVGRNGVTFMMYKFRSMRVDSDSSLHKAFVTKLIKGEIGKDEEDTAPLKITDDPRVTKVGKIIRKFSLDELPQLINVVQGTMSLVGPRPCIPYEFEMYRHWYKKRTVVQPGITGLWQITGRSEVAFEDMILLDLYYIYNRSFALDFNILFETIFVVIGKKGGY